MPIGFSNPKIIYYQKKLFDGFPDDVAARVQYVMAIVMRANSSRHRYSYPRYTSSQPIYLLPTNSRDDYAFLKYLWTAFMVLGSTGYEKFGKKIIKHPEEISLFVSKQTGYLSTFSSESFFEKEFKLHMKKKYDNIPSYYEGIYGDIDESIKKIILKQKEIDKKDRIFTEEHLRELQEEEIRIENEKELQKKIEEERKLKEKILETKRLEQKKIEAQKLEQEKLEKKKLEEQNEWDRLSRVLKQRKIVKEQQRIEKQTPEEKKLEAEQKQNQLKYEQEQKQEQLKLEQEKINKEYLLRKENEEKEKEKMKIISSLVNSITFPFQTNSCHGFRRTLPPSNDFDIDQKIITFVEMSSEGSTCESPRYKSYTLLMIAATNQKDLIVEYLLKQGANPLITNDFGEKASDMVSSSSPVYELLLLKEKEFSCGNDINKKYSIKLQEEAGKSGAKIEKISEYLNLGAILDYQNDMGYTALMISLDAQNDRIAEYLIKKGASLLIQNKKGEIASDLTSSYSPLFELIKEKEKLKQLEVLSSEEKYSILLLEYVNTSSVQIQKISEYLALGADINFQNEKGYSVLMMALERENDRISEYLLKRGADPLLKNNNGETARVFVSRNSSICSIIKGYELLCATQSSNLSLVKKLLRQDKTLIDFQGSHGYTALLIAVEHQMLEMAAYLLEQGADLEITCDDGYNVFELTQDDKMLELLNCSNNYFEEDLKFQDNHDIEITQSKHHFFKKSNFTNVIGEDKVVFTDRY